MTPKGISRAQNELTGGGYDPPVIMRSISQLEATLSSLIYEALSNGFATQQEIDDLQGSLVAKIEALLKMKGTDSVENLLAK